MPDDPGPLPIVEGLLAMQECINIRKMKPEAYKMSRRKSREQAFARRGLAVKAENEAN